MRTNGEKPLAWVVTVSMGLGHERATFPFRNFAEQGIITINESALTGQKEKELWRR